MRERDAEERVAVLEQRLANREKLIAEIMAKFPTHPDLIEYLEKRLRTFKEVERG